MKLDEFVGSTIYSVMNALKETDASLRSEDLGSVWMGDIKTLGKDLVNVRLIKAEDPENSNKSIPAILFDYEVNIVVDESKGTDTTGKLSAGATLLQVFSVTAETTGSTHKDRKEAELQKLRFTIPVALPKKKTEPNPSLQPTRQEARG